MTLLERTPVLGLSERWSLARKLAGSAIVVIFHASLPAGLVREAQLQQAVGVLLDTYPILRHSVLNPHGNEPFYEFDETIQCGDIVRVLPLSPSVDRTELIRQANLNGMTFDVTSGPMIQCQLHQSITPDRRDSLVLLFDHVLCDGLGGRNLFSDLLSLLSAQTLPPAPNGLPLRLDDTVDCTPAVTRARIVSNYPPLMPTYDARSGEQFLTDFALSANTLQNLLTVMKRHGVSTLHPVLHTASLVALHLATGLIDPCVVLTSTPISERDERKGHPRSTGNYVVFHYATTEIASSMSFWDEARRFSASLREPSTRINARSTLGAVGQDASREAHESGTEGWGAYIDGLISKSNGAGRLGVAVSNVGKLDLPSGGKLAEQVRDVYFAQSSSAVGAAIVLSIISYTSGPLAISVCSKDGSLPPGVLAAFNASLETILVSVAADEIEDSMQPPRQGPVSPCKLMVGEFWNERSSQSPGHTQAGPASEPALFSLNGSGRDVSLLTEVLSRVS